MAAPGWTEHFVARFESLGLPYMVTGSVASMLYGEPRLTMDIDLVIELGMARAEELLEAFPEPAFYRPPLEVLRLELSRETRGHFNLIHVESGMKADVYPVAGDPLHRWGLSHRRRVELDSGGVWLAPPEYVILRKLEFWREGGSEKHLRDVRGMLCAELELDDAFVERELEERGLTAVWRRLRAEP